MLQSLRYAHRTTLFLVLFSLFFFNSANLLFAQTDPEVQAKNYFDEGNFEQALPVFEDLVRLYPSDEELNYYYGACLIETGKYTTDAKNALEIAEDDEVKSLYYLGKYYHALSNWSFAMSYYNDYIDSARNRDVRNSDVNELVELCEEKVNPFKPAEEELQENSPTATTDTLTSELPKQSLQVPADSILQEVSSAPEETNLEIPQSLKDETINFMVNSSISYLNINQFKTTEAQQAYIKGWLAEQKLKNKLDTIAELRSDYASASYSEQQELATEILNLEQETYQINRDIQAAYSEANSYESNYWSNAPAGEINAFRQRINEMRDSIQTANTANNVDENLQMNEDTAITLPVISQDTSLLIIREGTGESAPPADVITYKIQIGAYSRTPPEWVQNLFDKISMIRKIDQYTDDNGVTVYTIGELKKYQDALQMQNQIRQEGITDAFIAAYKNNERITVSEARRINGE